MLLTNPIGPATATQPGSLAVDASKLPDSTSKATHFTDVAEEVAKKIDGGGRARVAVEKSASNPATAWENESFGFADFIDIINPLHHIPIVATLYRKMSGDQIAIAPRIVGGALWGRLGGFVAGAVNSFFVWLTGKDIGDHVYAALFERQSAAPEGSLLAETPPAREPLKHPDSEPLLPTVQSRDRVSEFHYGHGEIEEEPMPDPVIQMSQIPECDDTIPPTRIAYLDADDVLAHTFHATA